MASKYNAVTGRFYGATAVNWDSALDVRVLLLKQDAGLTFDATHANVAAILAVAGNTECTDASYARVAVTEANRNVNLTGTTRQARIGAAIDFGALDNEEVGAAIFYIHAAADADAIPLTYHDDNLPATANGAGFTLGGTNAVVMETEANPV
jgi:hypothetical protein